MAKGNLFLGMGRGSVGDVVFTRQGGQQVARARNRRPSNPKTEGQIVQRMLLALVSYAYSGLKTIVDHSFEGINYGQDSMSQFMSRNLGLIRADAAKVNGAGNPDWRYAIKNVRTLYPNPYVVSSGSLQPFGYSVGANAFAIEPAQVITPAAGGMTLAQLITALGASYGQQITFLAVNANQDDSPLYQGYGDSEDTVYPMALAVRRIKFKATYSADELNTVVTSTTANMALFDEKVTNTGINFAWVAAAGDNPAALSATLDGFATTIEGGNVIVAGAVIRSEYTGDAWRRSSQSMKISTIAADTFKGASFAVAFDAWQSGTETIGASSYVLNGKSNTDFGIDPINDGE